MDNDNVSMKDKEEWVDYPYLGRGEKPAGKHLLTDEELERIIGG